MIINCEIKAIQILDGPILRERYVNVCGQAKKKRVDISHSHIPTQARP